ncbi:MAG TPA: PaaI family thioesterase [Spirochaetota bacterium]|nr:PaaI family thioesterase [Spirochaetota bacterium]HPI88376.1 PaaI family thioesterase [Spirochaetota bacterium]HPR46766.1 PaaI family thioesterase [Spirochaetota bacterium]
MENKRKGPLQDISEKMVSLMKLFEGKRLGSFPVQCVTAWLDGRLLSIERGRVSIEYLIREEMTNPNGFLHGGIQATMLDDCIGIICASLGYDTTALSIDLHVNFLGQARKGDLLVASAEIEREGGSVIHAQASLVREDGDKVATVLSNILISSFPAPYLEMVKKFIPDL